MPWSHLVMADMLALPLDNMLTMPTLMFGGVCDRIRRSSSRSWRATPRGLRRSSIACTRASRAADIASSARRRADLAPVLRVSVGETSARCQRWSISSARDVLFWASTSALRRHFPGAVTEAVEGLASLPDRITRKVLGENAARMFGVTR
jgi:hypothetical protein